MAPLFYQSYSDVLGQEVVDAVLSALHTRILPSPFNHTYITLIPKKKSSEYIADFWLISLCNVLYKIVAKVLANRLKLILPHIISPTQSAFVPGRPILDNVFIAYKMMHFLNNKRQGWEGFMSLKLDINKVYDRVE